MFGSLRSKIYSYKLNAAKKKLKARINNFISKGKDIESIALLYYIPKDNLEKYNNWEDGFTKAIDLLSEDFKITKFNLYDSKPNAETLNQFDLVIGKSCWNWIVDSYIQSLNITSLKGIVVSCSKAPNVLEALEYDIVWYETEFYEKSIHFHPNAFRAFGINSDVFKPTETEKDIDVLGIGAITAYKRFDKFNTLPGDRKVIIGSTNTPDFREIKANLDPSIEIIEYASQQDLASLINRAKLVYLPCELNGGGERAVLESLSCGAVVKVEDDNPKLKNLINSRNITKYDYYNALVASIKHTFNKKTTQTNLLKSSKNLTVGRYSFYNKNFKIKGQIPVYIGSFCSFGENITLITENHDTNYPSTQGFLYRHLFNEDHPGEQSVEKNSARTKGPIQIGNDVWIGDNVFIFSGVKIGDGACIGAGSIVTKDVPDYSIVGGIPAKVLKYRYNDEIVEFLKSIKWWEWTDNRIAKNKKFFSLNLNQISLTEIKKCIE